MYILANAESYRYSIREMLYVLEIIPLSSGLAAISSDQKLSLFNPLSLQKGPLNAVSTTHGNIKAAKAFDPSNSIVCTAGENGSVSLWDLRVDASRAQVAQLSGSQAPVLSLACAVSTDTVAAGTEFTNHQASVLLWDVRKGASPWLQYNEIHSDDVTELNFHPSDAKKLLSGSTDGLVNVSDTRTADEDEVVIQAFNHGSVHHAGFLNNTEVYALSHDEKFAIYDTAEEEEKGSATNDFGDIREVLKCQYVANVTPKSNGSGAVVGAGAQDQQLFQLIHMTKNGAWSFDAETVVGLPGAHGEELVRSFCFSDHEQLVFTAGEDGQIKSWRPN